MASLIAKNMLFKDNINHYWAISICQKCYWWIELFVQLNIKTKNTLKPDSLPLSGYHLIYNDLVEVLESN